MARRVSVPELVGRRAELDLLDTLMPSGLVLVDGDAGVGKTRLVQAFAARVADRATVLTGGCLQFEADVPYAPFAEALPGLFEDSPTGDRAAAYRRIAEAISRAGDQVVLVLEDLHWADASTRDLLRHLHRALADVLIVATCRADELTADHPVATLVAELARSPRTERLHLGPLDRTGVAALARAVLNAEPAPVLVDQLVARAEGNPFFTEELLAAWPGSGDVPRTVRDIVLTRLARLGDDAQHLARIASVAGRTVPHDLLQGLGAFPEDRLGTALRELVDHGQLTAAGSDAYAFRHALIHESLYRDLLPGERRAAHARIARHLADHPELAGTRSAAGAAAELAHHWDAAGDPARALAASVEAASAAAGGLAPAEAHAHYERALRRWRETADRPAGLTHGTLLERAAEAASLAGHNQRAVELTKARIAELAGEETERVALAYEQLSYQARSAGNWELARSASRQSVRLVPADSPARLRIESWLMMIDMLAGQHLDAVRRAERLLPYAADDPMVTNRALTALGTGHVMLGHVAEGVEHLRRHREFADRSATPRFIGVGYVNTAESLIWADRQVDALALARQGVERATEYGFDIYLLPILGNVVRALAELHRWDEAVDATRDPDDPSADPFNWVFVDLPRAEILLRRGDLAGAAGLLKRIGAVLDGQGDVQYGTELAGLRARLAAAEHRWDDARAAVRAGLDVALSAQEMWLASRLVATGVQVEADAVTDDAGSADAADELLTLGHRHRVALEAAGAVALPRTLRAQALADAERTRLGTPDPAAWVTLAELAGVDRYLAGYARFREAEALLQVKGSRTRAAEAIGEAAETAAALDAAPLAGLTAALASRGRLTPRPTHGAAHGLTARETEILALVGRGLTNAEIAGELFISTKTASVHVSNILRKLGLKSRIQAAALAHRAEQT